ncbi:Crp/Fnr family transcriptional regulator [Williamwhitmania taraxaci]|uniref:CRP/FNR family transcriptional regulator, anaerobic regulatory protein n=1 Tax=Williamwhitmania taraxaci TaxID=1640674 RepID=A0A1G6GU28_9BACT|nr:Crp/Fnr family transcriptional regulator [Williamwhitmania taraxaci]SDB85458.1 CRP/FNR family transcriptional regulator, anaerobic regulatory protein [Williamwhitmania taraxaci]
MKTITESDQEFCCDIKAPCFSTLTAGEVDLVKTSRTQVVFRKGENLIKQGAYASYILFVSSGLVKQYVEGDGNHNFNIRLQKAGDFVGLSTIFNRATFNYSVQALRETVVYLIEKEVIANVMKQNGEFAFQIGGRSGMQENDLYDILQNLIYKQMHGKLADVLLYLSSEQFTDEELFPLLSRKDIADFAGISTESAVKLLKSFARDGIIALEEKNITILNRNLLLDISKRG